MSCLDCGYERDYYMVLNKVWHKAGLHLVEPRDSHVFTTWFHDYFERSR